MNSLVDTLPYYDKQIDLDPGLNETVRSEIARELKVTPQIREDDERLPPLVELFKSTPLKTLSESYPTQTLKSQRSIDPALYSVGVPEEGSEVGEWERSEERARIARGYLEGRTESLDLLATYGPNAWLVRNYQLESQAKELESEVELWKGHVDDLNRKRRVFQESTGQHLTTLETRWQDLVQNTVQLEMANKAMELEVQVLRGKEERLEKEMQGR